MATLLLRESACGACVNVKTRVRGECSREDQRQLQVLVRNSACVRMFFITTLHCNMDLRSQSDLSGPRRPLTMS